MADYQRPLALPLATRSDGAAAARAAPGSIAAAAKDREWLHMAPQESA
jgi:hypothetical protein